ncbi:MAG: hypothetical protein IJ628_05940 [Bacteroidaceae bacterium]|nr:hypothetical protein [Bacteroidaceae bacterium]
MILTSFVILSDLPRPSERSLFPDSLCLINTGAEGSSSGNQSSGSQSSGSNSGSSIGSDGGSGDGGGGGLII